MRRTKPTGCYVGRESSFQRSAIQLIRSIAAPYGIPPELVMHIPNGRHAGSVAMGKFWAGQGVVSGYPDCVMFVRRGGRSALALELKVWPKKLSPKQKRLHELLRSQGWAVFLCYGLEEVEQHTKEYLAP